MTRLLSIALALTHAVQGDAKDLRSAARSAYQACFKETAGARNSCSSGGCGHIVGSCYERQIAVFESDSARIAASLGGGRCAAAAATIGDEFDRLDRRLSTIPQFDDTWSGFDVRVALAESKNRSLDLLATECRPAPKAAR